MKLKNKTALITGASSGIGAALAHELSRCKMQCILVSLNNEALQQVADSVEKETGLRPITYECNVTDSTELAKVALQLQSSLQDGLHLLVVNAGMTMHGRFEGSTNEALRRTMELNFFAVVETVRAFLPLLKKATGEKRITLTSTPSGLYGIKERFGYSASKAAAGSFIESISHELIDDHITTTIFYPGYVATALRTSGISADGQQIAEEQAKNAKTPEEVAQIFRRAIEADKRRVFTNATGRFIFYGRVFASNLLDKLIRKKH